MAQNTRDVLHSAYTYVRSVEANQSSAAITLDYLIDARIKSLQSGAVRNIIDGQGNTVGTRSSRADQLTNLQNSLNQLIQAIQAAGTDEGKLEDLGLIDDGTTTGDVGSEG